MDEIDYDLIDKAIDEFTLGEASCLWVGIPPKTPKKDTPPSKRFEYEAVWKMLKKAGEEGRLAYAKPPETKTIQKFHSSEWIKNTYSLTSSDYFVNKKTYIPVTEEIQPTFYRESLRAFALEIGHRPLFLFPEDRAKNNQLKDTAIATKSNFKHSDDYRSVNLNGEEFSLTPNQSQVIKFLHEACLNETPELSQHTIMEKLESPTSRLVDTFKEKDKKTGKMIKTKAWEKLIIKGSTKGTYRLNI